MVDKAGLQFTPARKEVFPLRGAQFAELQPFDPSVVIRQFRLCLASGSIRENNAAVLRPDGICKLLKEVLPTGENRYGKLYCPYGCSTTAESMDGYAVTLFKWI